MVALTLRIFWRCIAGEDSALDSVDHELFDELIWPSLYEYVPSFGDLKVQSSWAGFYEYNTLDQNGIIGKYPLI